MKGREQQVVENAVRRAVRDVYFLINLQNQVNGYQMTEERVWSLTFAALEGNLRAIMREKRYQDTLQSLPGSLSRGMPYPVDAEMAATINAAIKNSVTTWDELDDDNILDEWFYKHLIEQGAREIPDSSHYRG